MNGSRRNWAGNLRYRATAVERPSTLGDLQRLVASSTPRSVLGSRHTFNAIGDGETLIDLSALASPPVVDDETGLASVSGATTYTELVAVLDAHGRALHNLASLPHITVAGALATGTHGSGIGLGNLATAVDSIEFVTATGDLAVVHRHDADFHGAVVHLGALGVVSRVTLCTEPAYEVSQTVHDGLEWDALVGSFDAVLGSATSTSVFTRWGEAPGEVWQKQRTDRGDASVWPGWTGADRPRHPIPGASPDACTPQGGVAGPWWDRLPHFRADTEPSAGAEIQSEMFVDRAHGGAAVEALLPIGPELDPVLLVSEIRTVAADDFWLSPCTGRDSAAFHFTWRRDPGAVAVAVERIADVLEPWAPRPHWGKALPAAWRASDAYERLGDFVALKQRFDPDGLFTTPWLARHLD